MATGCLGFRDRMVRTAAEDVAFFCFDPGLWVRRISPWGQARIAGLKQEARLRVKFEGSLAIRFFSRNFTPELSTKFTTRAEDQVV